MKARLFGHKATGGKVEILVERLLADNRALAQVRASKAPREGGRIFIGDFEIEVAGRREEMFLLALVEGSFGKLMEDLTPWFLLGFVLSGLITVVVPDDFFGETIPTGFIAMLAMLALSMPMYICATASTPVAAALVLKGLDPGAALVLLLAGPATNITTMLVVRNFLGTAVLRVYIVSLVVVSLLLGWLVNLLYAAMEVDLSQAIPHVHEMRHGVLATAGGVVLAALLLFHAWRLWVVPRKKSSGSTIAS
jgi:hypothetical protein